MNVNIPTHFRGHFKMVEENGVLKPLQSTNDGQRANKWKEEGHKVMTLADHDFKFIFDNMVRI